MTKPARIARTVNALDPDLALRGYTKDSEWMFKTGLGGTLAAASAVTAGMDLKSFIYMPIAIALYSLLTGFILRTVRMRLREPEAKLAAWSDWVDLFMSGLTWLALQFGLVVLAAMVITFGILLSYYAVTRGGAPSEAIAELCFVFVVAVLFWLSFLSSYLMINFAHEERLASGFAIRKVFLAFRANPGKMLLAWALANAIQIVAVVGPLCTVIGVFLVPSTFFSGQIVSATLLSQTWRAAFEEDFKY